MLMMLSMTSSIFKKKKANKQTKTQERRVSCIAHTTSLHTELHHKDQQRGTWQLTARRLSVSAPLKTHKLLSMPLQEARRKGFSFCCCCFFASLPPIDWQHQRSRTAAEWRSAGRSLQGSKASHLLFPSPLSLLLQGHNGAFKFQYKPLLAVAS